MREFLAELRAQRWDDHRYYHHSRVNQSLHFLSAISFLVAYVMMFKDPVVAALIGWLVAMVSRQSGHFFFEPKGYDDVNQATHEHKEAIKVGYNLRRKVILHVVWILVPFALWANPTLFGFFPPRAGAAAFLRHVGEIWLFVGIGALLFRIGPGAYAPTPGVGVPAGPPVQPRTCQPSDRNPADGRAQRPGRSGAVVRRNPHGVPRSSHSEPRR